jgi:peptide chain release factor 2
LSPKSPTRGGYFDLDKTQADIDATEWETQQPDFWKDNDHAQKVSRRLAELKEHHSAWKSLSDDAGALLDFAQLAYTENDEKAEADIVADLGKLKEQMAKMEFDTLLNDKYDDHDAIMAIHAGAGGTEAQDWAEMLLRMFLRYAEAKKWRTRVLDEHRGAEAGIKSVTVAVEGRHAYGHLKSEAGVHRLVRISPFDAEKLRHTSFALVEVLPELGDIEEVKIKPEDLRIDTFLASGHGGQGVQTTYSAVRVTHLPTGIIVSCQNERSQTQNKETALRILRAKLHAVYLREREAEKKKLRGEFQSAEWGNQIRSYVLHPYKLVKDHRTKFEMQEAEAVLNGALDPFVESYLRFLKQKND